ncbi:MAG: glycoside hydrolase family 3 C-terminal domain-containing protein [Clostridia bacterium]|nr:glycoside hydrolase family 3 C-terminal domain-containing protein [Clostridia bacterium]
MFDYQNPALPVERRVADLLGRMTLREKAAQTCMMRGVEYATKPDPRQFCSVEPDTDFDWDKLAKDFGEAGIGFVHDMYSTPVPFNKIQRYFVEHTRLGIPVIFTGEALHGISGIRGTVFPCPLNFGATFDPDLVHRVGEAIGRETRALGMYEILAPNLDVAREPRWGRVEETFGEDTYLSSRMAAAIVSGEQKGDISRPDAVIAEPKHYCVHGIAEGGTNCAPARAGRREVESCYLPVFEAGIREGGAYNVMVAYNCVDGDPLMASEWYLKDVLKERFKLKGYSRSDWGGVGRLKHAHHLVATDKEAIGLAMRNGLDVQGCDYDPDFWRDNVVALVEEGSLSMERLDDIVSRVLRVKFELGLFEHPYTDEEAWESVIRCGEHREVSHEIARESVVLLKNDGVLPFKKDLKSVAVIGPSSAAQKIGGYSSTPQFHIPSVYEELKAALGEGVTVRQCNGCAITYDKKQPRVVDGQPHLWSEGEEEIVDEMEEALAIAASCDAVVFVGGDNTITSGEGRDRCELTLNGRQRELIEKLSALGKPLVLVLENGKALELSRESEVCGAILMTFFGGESGARAIVEALTGEFSPAGRLPLSLPRSSTRIPCYYSMLPGGATDFLEGPKNALYSFGHGLSYTKFEYSDLAIEKTGPTDAAVTVKVKNVGTVDGDEVVQLYLDDCEASVVTPPMLLKGFKRISLKAGEEQTVSFTLDYDSFKVMGIRYNWTVEPGRFRVLVGGGSRDIRLCGEITIE